MKTMTLEEKLDSLATATMTTRELRISAKVAMVCGDLALAKALREEHDKRLTLVTNEKGYLYALAH